MAAEFVSALSDFPIVFAADEESVIPVLLLGMRNSENVFIGPEGGWNGRYIPAFIRRYPFVLAHPEDQENTTPVLTRLFLDSINPAKTSLPLMIDAARLLAKHSFRGEFHRGQR